MNVHFESSAWFRLLETRVEEKTRRRKDQKFSIGLKLNFWICQEADDFYDSFDWMALQCALKLQRENDHFLVFILFFVCLFSEQRVFNAYPNPSWFMMINDFVSYFNPFSYLHLIFHLLKHDLPKDTCCSPRPTFKILFISVKFVPLQVLSKSNSFSKKKKKKKKGAKIVTLERWCFKLEKHHYWCSNICIVTFYACS